MNETTYYLTLTEVVHSTHSTEATVITAVEHGIVEPRGRRPADWRFDAQMLAVLQRALRLRQDLELDWAGAALALQLLDQLRELREDNERLRRELDRLLDGR
jgi:chaperone modulatory protein CbpM